MRKEFMFYIRNDSDAKEALSSRQHLEFVKQCEVYIGKLKSQGKLIAAQPLIREGIRISKSDAKWNQTSIDTSKDVQVGYYHILADDIIDAIAIAKENPEFAYVPSASIEIRPIKTKEEVTEFVYPK